MNDLTQHEATGGASVAAATAAGGASAAPAASGRVLVLGSDTRSFLSVVRSLGRYGLCVDAAWTHQGSIALRSRYLNQVHELPTPWDHPSGWLSPFNDLVQSQLYDLVIPCNDPSLIPLQRSRSQLQRPESIYLLDDRTFEITQSKVLSTALAESLGICVPRSRVVHSANEGLAFAGESGYPVVLKPTQSYAADKLHRKQEVKTVRSEAELSAALARLLEDGSVQAQEHFAGVGTGVEFLADQGRVLFAFQHLRLHEPLKGGGSSYRTSIPLHHQMLEATEKLVAALHYSGVGMVEFRWDRQRDRWIFVEINGRFWGSLPLALASGADFPKFLYQCQVEKIDRFPGRYRIGVCCRNWERDKNWLSEQRSSKGGLRGLAVAVVSEAAAAAWRGVALRERSDTLTWDDPRPAMAEAAALVGSVCEGVQRRGRRALANWGPIRRRHRWRAAKALQGAKSILFVCKGNICRSPFAEVYARSIFPEGTIIRSAGYYPVRGRSSPAVATAAAARLGVDLSVHRSTVLGDHRIDDFDLIFVFDDENRCTLRSQLSQARGKIFYLGVFGDGGSEIADPYGGEPARFDKTYHRIQDALNKIARTLPCSSCPPKNR